VRKHLNVIIAYAIMLGLIILVGIFQSWNVALSIFNMCLISAVMTMGLVQLLSTDYKFAVSFSILVIVLLYRPNGIFKGKVL